MSTSKMPGFAAEASLYRANEAYATIRTFIAPADQRMILPQQLGCYQRGAYICCCRWGVCRCWLRPDLLPQ
jgi:hypothetical protein